MTYNDLKQSLFSVETCCQLETRYSPEFDKINALAETFRTTNINDTGKLRDYILRLTGLLGQLLPIAQIAEAKYDVEVASYIGFESQRIKDKSREKITVRELELEAKKAFFHLKSIAVTFEVYAKIVDKLIISWQSVLRSIESENKTINY